MKTKKSPARPRPTDGELAILRVLWSRGTATVREVHTALNAVPSAGPGYTTVLKLIQIMTGKGLVRRDTSQRPQVYSTTVPQTETQRQLVRDLLRRAFGGSHRQLVLQVLTDGKASENELREIETLLDRIEVEKT